MPLLVQLPLVKQMTYRHKPDFVLRPVQESYSVKYEPGKQLIVAYIYPAAWFFESSSLTTSLLVPADMASIIAP